MKKVSGASKKVTAENLAGLGAERLAEILVGVAETRPDLKRRLRMELAAEQGASPLAAEIDKRLTSFETSRGQITWRQRPAFLRDLDALRQLIADRLAVLDPFAAFERLWRFMATARQVGSRLRDREEVSQIFERAAGDLGRLMVRHDPAPAAAALVDALAADPSGWKVWLPALLADAPAGVAEQALRFMSEQRGAVPGWITLVRQLADAADDVDAFRATYTASALVTPQVAAEVARRLLSVGRIQEAGATLTAAAPNSEGRAGRATGPDFDWETVWIDYLDRAGRRDDAQAARWASFERTLSADRARAFTGRLEDFADVEAENRAFAIAASHPQFERGLRFLMEWPALVDASSMIMQRADEIEVAPAAAEVWAAKLRRRHPSAAHLLLRKAAAAAFRQRDFKTCDRLTQEAETIEA